MRTWATAVAAVIACLAMAGCGSDRLNPGSRPRPRARSRPRTPTRPRRPARPRGGHPHQGIRPHGSDDWWLDRPAQNGEIAAYLTHSSGVPGTRVGLKVSTSADRYRAWPIGSGRTAGVRSPGLAVGRPRGRVQPAPVFAPSETRTIVAPWRRSLTSTPTAGRPATTCSSSGPARGGTPRCPTSSPRGGRGNRCPGRPGHDVAGLQRLGRVQPVRGPDGDRRSWAVSFDRPYHAQTGANDFRTAALPIVRPGRAPGHPAVLLRQRRPPCPTGRRSTAPVATSRWVTTSTGPPRCAAPSCAARDAGTNLAFLGANTMYWRIRLTPGPSGPTGR